MKTTELEDIIEKQEAFLAAAKAAGDKRKAKMYKRSIKRFRADLAAARDTRPADRQIVCGVERRTAKAVLVRVIEDQVGDLNGKTIWLPLSQIDLLERTHGAFSTVILPAWLAEKKESD